MDFSQWLALSVMALPASAYIFTCWGRRLFWRKPVAQLLRNAPRRLCWNIPALWFALWVAGGYLLLQALFHQWLTGALTVPARLAWLAGVGGYALLLVALLGWNAYRRYLYARVLVDAFELDEALHAVAAERYGESMEPTRAAWEVALFSAYRYLELILWGGHACDWSFVFRAAFRQNQGWSVPVYPWLQHLGGPALLNVDGDLLLVSEQLTAPLPQPIPPAKPLRTPLCLQRPSRWPHQVAPGQKEEPDLVSLPSTDEADARDEMMYYLNAELAKFGRIRYAVLVGLPPGRVEKNLILVRTRDGLPLEIPAVQITYELFARGTTVREARRRYPDTWQELAWEAVQRLLQQEKSHWHLRSATDLPQRVMSGVVEGTFQRVFVRYSARQLLDRVQRATIQHLLSEWPPESRLGVEQTLQYILRELDTRTWQEIHDALLEAFNGPHNERAEERGLLVTQLSFGDWRPPKNILEAQRYSLRAILQWDETQQPSAQEGLRRRSQAESLHMLADLMQNHLPYLPEDWHQILSLPDYDKIVHQVRSGWLKVWDHLLTYLYDDPWANIQISPGPPPEPFRFEGLQAEDPREQERALTLWLTEVWRALVAFPWGTEPGSLAPTPSEFLDNSPS